MTSMPFETDTRPVHPDRLPTLTEVLELGGVDTGPPDVLLAVPPLESSVWEEPAPPLAAMCDPADFAGMADIADRPDGVDGVDGAELADGLDEQALAARVLLELVPRLEAMFESRLNDAVSLALASAVELVMRESRVELSDALRDLVDEAIARALSDRRTP